MTKEKALEKLNILLEELSKLPVYNPNTENAEFNKWYRKSTRYIEEVFKERDRDQLREFTYVSFYPNSYGWDDDHYTLDIEANHKGRKEAKALIESFIEEVEEWPDITKTLENVTVNIHNNKPNHSSKVFIVHGHDEAAKQSVARFIEKFNLEPIILHEQASRGDTVIEKIEEYTDQVGFAIVLYTECDIGGKDQDNLRSRARQNVVLEHGYLMAKLSRKNVCALVKGNVETPSDISGVVYVSMEGDSWHLPLAKELRVAGYDIDMNKIF